MDFDKIIQQLAAFATEWGVKILDDPMPAASRGVAMPK